MNQLDEITHTATPAQTPQDNMSSSLRRSTENRRGIEKEFVWGAGIECSFLPHLKVDQFEWTQHNRFWRDDFKRAREELGINTLRYALPWHQIEVTPGKFDWSMADERINAAKE